MASRQDTGAGWIPPAHRSVILLGESVGEVVTEVLANGDLDDYSRESLQRLARSMQRLVASLGDREAVGTRR